MVELTVVGMVALLVDKTAVEMAESWVAKKVV
jgi:hypothetical protein